MCKGFNNEWWRKYNFPKYYRTKKKRKFAENISEFTLQTNQLVDWLVPNWLNPAVHCRAQSGRSTSGPSDVNLKTPVCPGSIMGPGGCVKDCTQRKWCMTAVRGAPVAHQVEPVPFRLSPYRRDSCLRSFAACPPIAAIPFCLSHCIKKVAVSS